MVEESLLLALLPHVPRPVSRLLIAPVLLVLDPVAVDSLAQTRSADTRKGADRLAAAAPVVAVLLALAREQDNPDLATAAAVADHNIAVSSMGAYRTLERDNILHTDQCVRSQLAEEGNAVRKPGPDLAGFGASMP